MGRCIKELERIYGIYQGGSGYYGNQHEESSNNYKTPKTESDIAKELGISISSLQNYKKLTEMIPELEELVDTGIVTKTTALAIMKVKQPYHSFISDIQKTNKCSCFLNRTCYNGIGGSDTMKYICTLEMAVNCCQHCDPESKYCTAADTQCGFRQQEPEKNVTLTREYVRKPRWYEKYGK